MIKKLHIKNGLTLTECGRRHEEEGCCPPTRGTNGLSSLLLSAYAFARRVCGWSATPAARSLRTEAGAP